MAATCGTGGVASATVLHGPGPAAPGDRAHAELVGAPVLQAEDVDAGLVPPAGGPVSQVLVPLGRYCTSCAAIRARGLPGLGPLQARLSADGDRREDGLELQLLHGPEVAQPAGRDPLVGVGPRPRRAADAELVQHAQIGRVRVVGDRLSVERAQHRAAEESDELRSLAERGNPLVGIRPLHHVRGDPSGPVDTPAEVAPALVAPGSSEVQADPGDVPY